MHPYSDDELLTQDIETLKIVEHSKMVDSKEVSELFRKFKKKGILEQPIEMHMTEYKVYSVPQMEINDYMTNLFIIESYKDIPKNKLDKL